MNVKLVLFVLILYVIAFKFVYFNSDWLDLWSNFQEKLAGRQWLFPVVLLSQQRYSNSLYFGNAWFCYDVNTEFTELSAFINFSATRQWLSRVEYSSPTHQDDDSPLSSVQIVK